ncbi:hypothetical protein [Kitasatospora sp. NPDC054795]
MGALLLAPILGILLIAIPGTGRILRLCRRLRDQESRWRLPPAWRPDLTDRSTSEREPTAGPSPRSRRNQ